MRQLLSTVGVEQGVAAKEAQVIAIAGYGANRLQRWI
jgi:hypothetical protein